MDTLCSLSTVLIPHKGIESVYKIKVSVGKGNVLFESHIRE